MKTEIRDQRALAMLSLAAIAAILIGVQMLDGTRIASSYWGAAAGLLGQLSVTGPAAIVVFVTAGLQVAAGAVLMRAVRRAPYEVISDALLAGLVGAVAIGLVGMFALGSLGWFTRPVLLVVNGGVVGAGWFARPIFVTRPTFVMPMPVAVALLIGIAWSGAVVLQLASPVVPFLDVLPNHVAPAEHLRTFGGWAVLAIAPSPIYGPSRIFLGFTGLLGGTATMSGLQAALAVSGFILPGMILVATGMVRLAKAMHGPALAPWVLITFMLTASFARLADDRATVLVLPLVAFCLVELIDASRPKRPLVLAIGLAATVSVHPLIGVMTLGTVAALVAVTPGRYAPIGVPALLGGGLLALPQAATMLGLQAPSAAALVTIPVALAVTGLFQRFELLRRAAVAVLQVGGTLALAALVGVSIPTASSRAGTLSDFVLKYPVLAWTVAVGFIVAGRRTLTPVPALAIGVGFAGALAANAIPFGSLGVVGVNYEVAKTLHYWIPVFLAVMAAFALHWLWESPNFGLRLRVAMMGVFFLAASLPLRSEPIPPGFLGEHRLSETLSIQLSYAETGYWRGYPDSRTIINGAQAQLLDRLRAEIAAGRLGPRDGVLHVAFSFQQWASIPLGVFAGVMETTASVETEKSIHTAGGRLFPLDSLAALLHGGYRYVVFEPHDLPAGTRDLIIAAGYQSIIANARGEIFVKG